MTTFPVVRPSQRIRNVVHAIRLSGARDEYAYLTAADILEEIAVAVAETEERLASLADAHVIDALHQLRDVTAEYDPALLAARRAAFVKQIEAQNDDHEWQTPSVKDQLDDAGFGHSGQF